MDELVTAKFLRVTPAYAHGTAFHSALATALGLGARHEREKYINAELPDPIVVRLERLGSRDDFVFGELIQKQVSDIPLEANDDSLSTVQLSDGAGLGLSSAFRYHRPTRTLLIQANNEAVSIGRLNLYLKAVDENAEYKFYPVPRADPWSRFSNGLPRRLIIKIASPEDIAGLADGLDKESRIIGAGAANIAEALGGAFITIEVSMDSRRGSLLKGATERVLRTFRRLGNAGELDVKMLSASITDNNGTDLIDFLGEDLIVRGRLHLSGAGPDWNYEIRAAFLENQFNANLGYIQGLNRQ